MNEEELNEEESFEPDPSQGVAEPDFTLDKALLTKGKTLLGVGASAFVRNIYTKISKIDDVQEMLTKAQEQLPSISQKGVEKFKTQAAGRIQEIMRKLSESSFDVDTLKRAVGKNQGGGFGGGGLPSDDDDDEEEDINKLYEESQNPKNPNELENLLQQQAGTKGEAGSRIDVRSQYGYDVLANTPSKNLDLIAELGLTTNDALFLLSNYEKSDISRDASAAIQSLFTTVDVFNDVKKKALPFFLKAMKGIKRNRTPQLDHVAQLKSSLPFFNNAKVAQFPEIAKIIVEEGVFGLGHQRSNFKYLEFDVHTVKSRFFKNKVGANGEKFFLNRDISTVPKLRAAAREYAQTINDSNNIVADAIEQYKFMNKTEISEQELEDFVDVLGNQPIRRKYSIKQVRDVFKQMEEDGFIQTAKESQQIEDSLKRSEQKELAQKTQREARLEKDAISVENTAQQMREFLEENLDTFDVNPFTFNMKDEGLRELAENAYDLFRQQRLAQDGNIQLSLFDSQKKDKWVKMMMKSILNQLRRQRNR